MGAIRDTVMKAATNIIRDLTRPILTLPKIYVNVKKFRQENIQWLV